MPKYRIETPGGRVLTIEAATEAEALRGAQEWSASQGGGRGVSGEERAASLMDRVGSGYNPIMQGLMNNPVTRAVAPGVAFASSLSPGQRRAMQQGVTFGLQDEMVGGGAALGAALGNAFAGDGAEPDIRAGEAYRGVADQERARQAQFAEEAPVQNFALQAAGAAGNPLSWGGVGFIGRGANLAGQAGRGALVGAGYGGVVGAGMAQDGLGNRLAGGAGGAAAGAAFGAGAPYAATGISRLAQMAPRFAGGAQEAGRRMAGAMLPESGPARVTPAATSAALDEVSTLLARRGLTPDDLLANPVEALGKPITSAEAIGRPAMGQLTALGRRGGRTPDALEAALEQRSLSQGERVLSDIEELAGISPTFAAGDISSQAARLRRSAAPLYDAAYDVEAVQSTRLDDLARRPSVRQAMRRAIDIAREEGQDPYTLGLFNMEAPTRSIAAAIPAPYPGLADDVGALAGGGIEQVQRTVRREQGPSLLEFLSKRGGLRDNGAELSARDASLWHRAKPFRGRLVNPEGSNLDDAALAAWEAGYLQSAERPDINTLLQAIDRELAGRPIYAAARANQAEEAASRLTTLQRLDDEMRSAGIDPRAKGAADELARLRSLGDDPVYESAMPDYAPVQGEVPSMRAWDYVKRGLDDTLESERDPVTRRLSPTNKTRGIVGTLSELRDELINLNPAYRDALAAGGEPLRLESAFRDGAKLLNAATESQFYQRAGKMPDAEKQAVVAGWANWAYEQARAGKFSLRQLKAPAFGEKMRFLIGRDAADQLVERLAAEARLAKGGRMSPGTNSVTSDVLLADRAMEGRGGFLGGIERRLETGQRLLPAIGTELSRAATAPIGGFIRGFQAPYGQAVRDEVGRLLMSPPSELAGLLAGLPPRRATPLPALLPYLPGQAGQSGGRATPAN